jgi:hypothetical protein
VSSLLLFCETCHYNIQERDCLERVITSRNCTQGSIFWSYPRNNCSYAISQPISGQYSAEISVRELYSLNYTISITEQTTVSTFLSNFSQNRKLFFKKGPGTVKGEKVGPFTKGIDVKMTGPSIIRHYGCLLDFKFNKL